MKATGIVRRIDDLGRVVIPKEIRRSLKIHEGDPLEIFTNPKEQMVCFRKYMPFEEQDWEKARDILKVVYPYLNFALYDSNGDLQSKYKTRPEVSIPQFFDNDSSIIKNSECDPVGYLWLDTREMPNWSGTDENIIYAILREFFSNDY